MISDIPFNAIIWFSAYILSVCFKVFFARYTTAKTDAFGFSLLILLGTGLDLLNFLGLFSALALLLLSIPIKFQNNYFNHLSKLLLVVLSLGLAMHKIPGFFNQLVFSSDAFGQSGLPFTLYANVDKALAGLALLNAFSAHIKWRIGLKELQLIALFLAGFYTLALILGAEFELKFMHLTWVFLLLNLFITCIAEESFFRLAIQRPINKGLKNALNGGLAVLITAAIFMLAHFHTGEGAEKRLVLIFCAGLLYGTVYLKRNFGSAVMLHFSLNAIHFMLFTYPATFISR